MCRRQLKKPRFNFLSLKPFHISILAIFIVIGVFFFPIVDIFAVSVDATDISDAKYFPAVHNLLNNAKDSITVAMYEIYVDPSNPNSPPDVLIQDLINAQNRGVKVKVYLDKSIPYGKLSKLKDIQAKNEAAYYLLKKAGIDVHYIIPSRRLHDKLIIIDSKIVISGSTNWSYSALKKNSEDSNLLISGEYAKIKLNRIEKLKFIDESKLLPKAYLYKLKVSNTFLRNPNLAPQMVNKSQETLFDLYLYLLKAAQDRNVPLDDASSLTGFAIDYKKAASVVNLDFNSPRARYEIHRLLRKLIKDYHLIDVEFKKEGSAFIKIKPMPQKAYFNIPYAYWDYGWDKLLSLRAKFLYFINIYKQETSDIKPWWSLSREMLSDDFHISESSITRGMRELEKYQIVEVWRGRLPKQPESFADKPVNKYLLKQLPSPEVMKQKWEVLEKEYGSKLFKQAKKLAKLIDEHNHPEEVETFINFIDKYGYTKVEKATRITADLAVENPARHTGYIKGILENANGYQ